MASCRKSVLFLRAPSLPGARARSMGTDWYLYWPAEERVAPHQVPGRRSVLSRAVSKSRWSGIAVGFEYALGMARTRVEAYTPVESVNSGY